jgi:hypothetical protein
MKLMISQVDKTVTGAEAPAKETEEVLNKQLEGFLRF